MKERTQFFVEPIGVGRNWLWIPGVARRRVLGLRAGFGAAFGLEAFEIVQGAVEGAQGGIGAALEEGEVLAAADRIQALIVRAVADAVVGALVVPDFGVGDGIAAKQPLGVDEGGDEERLFGRGGLPAEGGLGGGGTGVGGGFRGGGAGAGIG